jgi:hypothetical protein
MGVAVAGTAVDVAGMAVGVDAAGVGVDLETAGVRAISVAVVPARTRAVLFVSEMDVR